MGGQHLKETGRGSFWGISRTSRAQNHFLRQLDQVIDWEAFGARWLALYEGHEEFGRPPYPPETLVKMLLVT